MKRGVILVLLSLPLAGCLADQKQQIAACKLEATRLYPNEVPPLSDKLNTYVRTCMEAHGYEYDAVQKKCEEGYMGMGTDAYCYVPASWFGRLTYKLETGGPFQ
jgi:hypothetical protein